MSFRQFRVFFLSREPLPENLQKIVDAEQKKELKAQRQAAQEQGVDRKPLPFEPGYSKKKASS